MIKQIKTLLGQPSEMFYTLMMWVSFYLSSYFVEPKGHFIWKIEYPILYAFFYSLCATLLCTAINAYFINKPKPEITIYNQIIYYSFSMLIALTLFAIAHGSLLSALGLASALWMAIEQGRKKKRVTKTQPPTSNNQTCEVK